MLTLMLLLLLVVVVFFFFYTLAFVSPAAAVAGRRNDDLQLLRATAQTLRRKTSTYKYYVLHTGTGRIMAPDSR